MRSGWPFWIYAVVVVVHLVNIALTSTGNELTKALLMPVLLVSVLLVVLWTGRVRGTRAWWGIALLSLGIIASFLGDVLLGPSFIIGLACFAAAHILYIALFNGPARVRPVAWWSFAYVAVLVVVLVMLWPYLGELRPILIGYGVVLALTAMTSTRVGGVVAWGGGLFLASDALLAFRLFYPDFSGIFPDPWQDLAIMALYCAGEGLIAFGVVRRLRTRVA